MTTPSLVHEGKFLDFYKRGNWEYVQRHGSSGAVGILAVTPDQKILLVEQFRPPVQKQVVEIPAGLAGDLKGSEDEALATAARRELLEETGYEASEMRYLAEGPSSAGLCTEMVSFFQALNIRKIRPGGGDENENILVHEVSLAGLKEWLSAKQSEGCLIDYKIYTALYFLNSR